MASFLTSLFGYFILLLLWFFLHSLGEWLKGAVRESILKYPRFSPKHLRSQWVVLNRVSWLMALGLVALSWAITGKVFGAVLGLLTLYPFLKGCALFYFRRLQDRISVDFFSVLIALHGLLEAGVPYPQALRELANRPEQGLSYLLQKSLKSFEKGHSWQRVWNAKFWKSSESLVSRSFQLLESANRRGLSLLPLIESLIPLFEKEMDSTKRLKIIQRNFLIQCLLCALIPWLLGACSWYFHPEIVTDFLDGAFGKMILFILFLWEGLGIWLTLKVIRFY